jgi:glycerophosphoryl diester phosphodiesterase
MWVRCAVVVVLAACSGTPRDVPVTSPDPPLLRPRIVAHRGASASAPENTLLAFRTAWELGVESVELDVRLSRDGEVVVIHDETTERVAGVRRAVADQTLAELARLDAGRGEPIPTLAQALATVPAGRTLFVEIKTGAATAGTIAQAIRAADPAQRGARVALQGIDPRALAALAAALPEWPAYWTAFPPVDDQDRPLPYPLGVVAEARRRGFTGLALLASSVTEELLAEAQRAGLAMDVWTINDAAGLAAALARDDIRWIETDHPELAAPQRM